MMEKKEDKKAEKEGIIKGERMRKKKWRIIGIYMKRNIEEYLRIMEK